MFGSLNPQLGKQNKKDKKRFACYTLNISPLEWTQIRHFLPEPTMMMYSSIQKFFGWIFFSPVRPWNARVRCTLCNVTTIIFVFVIWFFFFCTNNVVIEFGRIDEATEMIESNVCVCVALMPCFTHLRHYHVWRVCVCPERPELIAMWKLKINIINTEFSCFWEQIKHKCKSSISMYRYLHLNTHENKNGMLNE